MKAIVQATGPDQIPPTQNQEYHKLQSTIFTTPTASSSRPSTPSHSHTLTAKDNLFDTVYSDDSDEEVPDVSQLDEKIEQELHFYKSIKLTHDQKKKYSSTYMVERSQKSIPLSIPSSQGFASHTSNICAI